MGESIRLKTTFLKGPLTGVVGAIEAICVALAGRKKLLIFGNGGSAADAQHVAAEFVNRYGRWRQALPAIALTTDSSVLTSIANDAAFEEIFSRQIEALGSPGDVAWGITTSGQSPNVVRGLKAARAVGLVTVAMTGKTGGEIGTLVDHWIHVDHGFSPRIQELQITLAHVICELVEERLFPPCDETTR